MSARPLIACLLPVRNGAKHLRGWFESVERFADTIIALDDGSTDDTSAMLEAHPLVSRILSNPRRETYHGWDDAQNRNDLLAAADEARPHWIMTLDVDERLDEDDGPALREFVTRSAVPGLAYGFLVHRMIGSAEVYDQAHLWVYRLFAHRSGQRVPSDRLHFVPVPTSIPRDRWIDTTLRIQHMASVDESARLHRFEKYRQVDPHNEFQTTYENLLAEPTSLHAWKPRLPGTPVLVGDRRMPDAETTSPGQQDTPALSAVVISRDDEDIIEQAVGAVVAQQVHEPFEIIVVVSGTDRTADIVRESFPDVTLIELDGVALPGRARNAGLEVARGEYISFPGSHVELVPGSLRARLRAHEAGWDMVTGTTVNGNHSYPGWSSYFLDHSGQLPGTPPTVLDAPPAHCSYRTSLVRDIGGFPDDIRTGEDTVVNHELFRLGYSALRDPDVRIIHSSPSKTLPQMAGHHFKRGRGLGRIVLDRNSHGPVLRNRTLVRRLAIDYLPSRVRTTSASIDQWGGPLKTVWQQVLPGFLLGAASAWLGAWWEILRPRRGWRAELLRRSGDTARVWILCTGYCPCEECCGEWADGKTSTSVDAVQETSGIASDNDLLPIGTDITIPGYGTATVDDTGEAMRDSAQAGTIHIDLRFATHTEAMSWGSQLHQVDIPIHLPAAALSPAHEPPPTAPARPSVR